MRRALVTLLISCVSPMALAAGEVPAENQTAGKTPDVSTFEAKAATLLNAIEKNDPDSALPVFFPKEAFVQLKAIDKPEAYYEQLVTWFREDIAREHERLVVQDPLTFAGLKPGSCKWKAKGSEANSIPYWSCSKTQILVKVGKKTETLTVHARINWGKDWFITHLGPIPKKS